MAPIPTSAFDVLQRAATTSHPEKPFFAEQNKTGRKLVGIDGKWYDITDFIFRHPGGPVIEHFVGHDATAVFYAYGHTNVLLKHRKPVGTYTRWHHHPADRDFKALLGYFQKNGFFETDWRFYCQKFAVCATLLATVFLLVCGCDSWYWHYVAAGVLASFWEQCGFLMHDFMHIQVFRNNKLDRLGGLIFGSACFGLSAHWWKVEHDVHHSVTNMVDVGKDFVDPQGREYIWAQNPKMFPLYGGIIQSFLIKIQHLTFIPAVALLGRIGILIDSYQSEKRLYEWLAISVHWTWMIVLLSCLPTWWEVMIFYGIAASLQGLLHFKLLASHYSKEFQQVTEFHQLSWFQHQLNATINITNPTWMDWFYGGLNLHIEHHMFPKMARSRFREASRYVKDICQKHGLKYDSISFCAAIWRTLKGLKNSSFHYSLDPR